MAYHQDIGEWHGKELVDRDGERIGKLEDVYVDVETNEPMFGTVKEGLIGRHLTFVPLAGITIGPDNLQVAVSKEQVKSAPNIELHGDELSRQTSRPSTTTTNSTTPHPTQNAVGDSPAADAAPGFKGDAGAVAHGVEVRRECVCHRRDPRSACTNPRSGRT